MTRTELGIVTSLAILFVAIGGTIGTVVVHGWRIEENASDIEWMWPRLTEACVYAHDHDNETAECR